MKKLFVFYISFFILTNAYAASDIFTNKYFSKYMDGVFSELVGYGSYVGEWRRYQIAGKTTYNNIDCLIFRVDSENGDYYIHYLMQDSNEDIRCLRYYGYASGDGSFDFDFSTSPVLFVPQNPYVGQSWTWVDGSLTTVYSINENVGVLSTGLGPYLNCLVLRWDQIGDTADIDYLVFSPTGLIVKLITNDSGQDGYDLSSFFPGGFFAAFSPGGIWNWNGTSWTMLTPSSPENMVLSDSKLYAEFGAGGIWMWNGTTWAQITPSNPENMVAFERFLYAEFGTGGIWMWNGTSWRMLTPSNPENMVLSGPWLYADFGEGGIWMWDGIHLSWTQLTPSNPENMAANRSTLYADFGAGGIWMWNGFSWAMLTPSNPESMVVSGSWPYLYADFGAGGLHRWNGSTWTMLAPHNSENMVAAGQVLFADFGAKGLWWWNGVSWTILTPSNPENMLISGLNLYAEFGTGGLWVWEFGTPWTMLTPSNPTVMAVSD